MALRGDEQFYFHITSDGSMDVYPDNKSSDFRIELKKSIDLGEEDWEVALTSINYPYSWTNLGPSAGTQFKYYFDRDVGEQEVKFPDWHCESMNNLIAYISAKIASKEKKLTKSHQSERFYIILDELNRVKIGTIEPDYDVGFSDSMLRILGLESNPLANNITKSAFDRRPRHRNFLGKIWTDDSMVNYRSRDLKRKFEETENIEDLVRFVYPHINDDALVKVIAKENTQKSGRLQENGDSMDTTVDLTKIQNLYVTSRT